MRAMCQYFKMFITELNSRGMSKNTIESYQRDLKQFSQYCELKNLEISDIVYDDIKDYLISLYARQNKSSTICRKVSSIKEFFKFVECEEKGYNNPARLVRSQKLNHTKPKFFSREEINKLIDGINISANNGLRDKTIIELMYSSGLRATEVCELQLTDVDFDSKYILVNGKGKKERIVPVTERAIDLMRLYKELRDPNCGKFFVQQKGRPFNRFKISNLIKKWCRKTGVRVLSAHCIRHTFATHLLENNCNLVAISEMMGHNNIKTTEIYTHLNIKYITKEFMCGHPRAKKES